jgi:hypothetical protein
MHDNLFSLFIIHCYKTAVLFVNYSILPSSCCLCTNTYYITNLIGSCPCVVYVASLKRTGRMRVVVCAIYYLLTPWSTVLLEKLTGSQLVKKFPGFYGTRKFITAFTSTRHLSLSWARSIQSIPSHPTSWRSNLILSTHLRLDVPSGLFPSSFPTKITYALSSPTYELHASPTTFSISIRE